MAALSTVIEISFNLSHSSCSASGWRCHQREREHRFHLFHSVGGVGSTGFSTHILRISRNDGSGTSCSFRYITCTIIGEPKKDSKESVPSTIRSSLITST